MSKVFISYKRGDIDLARSVKDKLDEAGFNVWMDLHIPGGKDWRDTIDEEISLDETDESSTSSS